MIPLIESSRKWTKILFIISNYNIGIWIFSQPRIYVNSQSNLYYVITLYHTRTFQPNLQTTYSKHILHIITPGYDPYTQVLSNFLFLCIRHRQYPIVTTTHAQTFGFIICQSHKFLPKYLPQKRHLKIL